MKPRQPDDAESLKIHSRLRVLDTRTLSLIQLYLPRTNKRILSKSRPYEFIDKHGEKYDVTDDLTILER